MAAKRHTSARPAVVANPPELDLPFAVESPAQRAAIAGRLPPAPPRPIPATRRPPPRLVDAADGVRAWVAAPTDTSAPLAAPLTDERLPAPTGNTAPAAASGAPFLSSQGANHGAAGNAPAQRSDASLRAQHQDQNVAEADRVTVGSAALPRLWDGVDLVLEAPWDPKPIKGEPWRAILVICGLRFAGVGASAWAALREAIDDYKERGLLGRAFRPSRTA